MEKRLIFFPHSRELTDITQAPEKEVRIGREEARKQGIYTWLIYIN